MGFDSTYPELTILKVVYNGFARRVKVPYSMEWHDFERTVCRLFNVSPPLVTCYTDRMGVSVIVDNNEDFFFFLDEENTGRLDIVIEVEASEALDWTVVRSANGNAYKEPDGTSKLSLSAPQPEKTKPEINEARSEPASSFSSVRSASLYSEKISNVQPEFFARAPTLQTAEMVENLENPQVDTEGAFSVAEKGSLPYEILPEVGENRDAMLYNVSKSEFNYETGSSGVAAIVEESFAGPSQMVLSYSSSVPETENIANNNEKEAEANADSISVRELEYMKFKYSFASLYNSTEADILVSQPQADVEFRGGSHLVEGSSVPGRCDHFEKNSTKVQGEGSEKENSVIEILEDEYTGDVQNSSEVEFNASIEESINLAPTDPSAPTILNSEPPNEKQTSASSVLHEPIVEAAALNEEQGEPEAAEQLSETADAQTSDPLADENERLRRSLALRSLCHKFNEDFRHYPALLTVIELFTDQISHGVPIDLKVLESGFRRLKPLHSMLPGVIFEEMASNLVGSVGEIVTRVGTSLGSFIDNEFTQFFSTIRNVQNCEKSQSGTHEKENEVTQPQYNTSEFKASESKARHCHFHQGCKHKKCHKHSAGAVFDKDASHEVRGSSASAMAEVSDGRCNRCCRHKHKLHDCSQHRSKSVTSEKVILSEDATKCQDKEFGSSPKTFSSTSRFPPKFSAPGSCSSSKTHSPLSLASHVGEKPLTTAQQQERRSGNSSHYESRRSYIMNDCLSLQAAAPHHPTKAVKPVYVLPQDLGNDISPDDVALIDGLATLREMGFCDDAAILKALRANSGCIQDAVEELLLKFS